MANQKPRTVDEILDAQGQTKGVLRRYIDANLDGAQADARRKTLIKRIESKTNRRLVIYAVDMSKAWLPGVQLMLSHEDITPLIDVLDSIPTGSLVDVLIESPGGYVQVAELIERLLRARFTSVRFIVPHIAMSAATVLAFSGDQILMDNRSSLGPIDPQINRPNSIPYPAQSYLDWLEKATEEESKTGKLSLVTLAILQKVTPADIQIAEDATEESRKLVADWIAKYMWAQLTDESGQPLPQDKRRSKARAVAERLASHKEWLSHGKMLSRDTLLKMDPDLRIADYSTLQFADEIWELWVNLHFTFLRTPAFKIYECAETRLVKNINLVTQQPGTPVPGQQIPVNVQSAQLNVVCSNCGAQDRVQANFQRGVPLEPGFRPFPANNKLKCAACGSEIDLSGARQDMERQTGKQVAA